MTDHPATLISVTRFQDPYDRDWRFLVKHNMHYMFIVYITFCDNSSEMYWHIYIDVLCIYIETYFINHTYIVMPFSRNQYRERFTWIGYCIYDTIYMHGHLQAFPYSSILSNDDLVVTISNIYIYMDTGVLLTKEYNTTSSIEFVPLMFWIPRTCGVSLWFFLWDGTNGADVFREMNGGFYQYIHEQVLWRMYFPSLRSLYHWETRLKLLELSICV